MMDIVVNIDHLKEDLKKLIETKGKTIKQVAEEAEMSSNGLHNKLHRQSITVKDLICILECLDSEIVIHPKDT